jgi:dTDP-4-dehydrorhamnose reductase
MKNKKILLIGGYGNLGNVILESNIFKNIYAPSKKKLNLLNQKQIQKLLFKEKFKIIINCASLARMKICEENISEAINNNIQGTFNLVNSIAMYEKKFKKNLKLVHLSSDAVYPSISGNYNENSKLGPYNNYGWTKLSAEFLVKMLKKYIIIRTRFFNKDKIKYKYSASDIYTSQLDIRLIPKYIGYLIKSNFIGIINVGGPRISDYKLYKKINNNLKPFKRKNLVKILKLKIAKDSSLNLRIFNKIKRKYE